VRILVNGAWRETVAAELSRVLDELGYGEAVVTTAVNGEFVAAGVRPRTRLAEGIAWKCWRPCRGGDAAALRNGTAIAAAARQRAIPLAGGADRGGASGAR